MVLAAAMGGGWMWHVQEERRKGEEAREQVLTALRITNQALDTVQMRLAEHDARAQRRTR
jgi:predicted type IV restriction endonuclease